MSFRFTRYSSLSRLALGCALLAGAAVSAPALAGEAEEAGEEAGGDAAEIRRSIIVYGERQEQPNGATHLPLTVLETPQSVTVVQRDYLDDFALDEANDVLRLVTGVNVDEVETDRTYYNSRGFDIKAMMVDGVNLPNIWGNFNGSRDTAPYDRIEIVRGANGLLSGTGNPSGTVNYIRRRPTGTFAFSGEASVGSWEKLRGEIDLDAPLDSAGNWAIRITGAAQSADSYLRDYESERNVIQAVISGALTDRLALTAGYMRQDGDARGVLWGALPILYSDGTPTDFPVGTSTTQDWTYWNTEDVTYFGELAYQLADDWRLTTTLTRREFKEPSRLFYVYGTPDAATGLGLYGYPGGYFQTMDGWISDTELQGRYQLFGREHEVTLGVQYSKSQLDYLQYPVPGTDPAWGALPALPDWTGAETPLPDFGDAVVSADLSNRMWRGYAATRIAVTDRLKLLAGANFVDVDVDGYSFGVDFSRSESAVSPFVGLTYEVVPRVNLYASYSDIFEPQSEIGADLTPLGSAKGKSYELGVKAETAGGLFASLALFRAEQSNLAEAAGYDVSLGQTLYDGIEVESQGIEAEIGGRINERLTVQGGITHLSLEDGAGNKVRTYVPRTTANLALRWKPVEKLSLGAVVKWQSAVYRDTAVGRIEQGAYATLQLQGAYDFTDRLGLSVNVGNVTDHKYLASLYWDQAFYAAPRNATVSLRWRY